MSKNIKNILVAGAGGFIGGHLVKRLLNDGFSVVGADIKPLEFWFQKFDKAKNFSMDLNDYDNCIKVTKGVDAIWTSIYMSYSCISRCHKSHFIW